MSTQDVPYIPPELLAWLERTYPERSPRPGETKAKLMFRGGQSDVVATLRRHHETQMGRALQGSISINVSAEE